MITLGSRSLDKVAETIGFTGTWSARTVSLRKGHAGRQATFEERRGRLGG